MKEQPKSGSWWVGLSRDQLQQEAEKRKLEMSASKEAVMASPSVRLKN